MYLSWLRVLLVACLIASTYAHTAFTTLFVNGVSQGDGTCVRMNTVSGRTNFPIADITSDDITCGQAGIKPVARTCPISAGDAVSFQFRSGPGSGSTESIVEGHSGPCAIYMKQMSSGDPLPDGTFPPDTPAGDGWFKIMYDDTDSQDQWCTERVNQTAEGVITTIIPRDLSPGYYLLRPELLALHAATKKDPQFYTGCAQVYISGGSGTASPDKVAIPGYVKYTDQAMLWNLYNQTGANYPEFGPQLYKSNADSSTSPQISSTSASPTSSSVTPAQSSPVSQAASQPSDNPSTTSTTSASTRPTCKDGRASKRKRYMAISHTTTKPHQPSIHKRTPQADTTETTDITDTIKAFSCPSNTILELGNLCLPEVPHWKDSDASMRNCWASSKYCWAMADTCWKTRSPAVSYLKGQGCDMYAQRCTSVADACKNSVMEGPVDEGQSITPEKIVLTGFGVQG